MKHEVVLKDKTPRLESKQTVAGQEQRRSPKQLLLMMQLDQSQKDV